MNHRRWLGLGALLVLHFCGAAILARQDAERETARRIAAARRRLERVATLASPHVFANRLASAVLDAGIGARWWAPPGPRPPTASDAWEPAQAADPAPARQAHRERQGGPAIGGTPEPRVRAALARAATWAGRLRFEVHWFDHAGRWLDSHPSLRQGQTLSLIFPNLPDPILDGDGGAPAAIPADPPPELTGSRYRAWSATPVLPGSTVPSPNPPAGTSTAAIVTRSSKQISECMSRLEKWLRFVRVPWLIDQPGREPLVGERIHRLQRSLRDIPNRTVGIEINDHVELLGTWRFEPHGPDRIAGGLVLVDHLEADRQWPLHALLARWRRRGVAIRALPLVTGQRVLPAAGVDRAGDQAAAAAWLVTPEPVLPWRGRLMVLHRFDDRRLLVMTIDPAVPVLPVWTWLCLFGWVLPFLRMTSGPAAWRWPLGWWLLGLGTAAAGLPLLLALLTWHDLSRQRERALVEAALTELEQTLAQIDGHFPAMTRQRDARYRDWVRRATHSWRNAPPRVFVSSPQGRHVRRPAAGTAMDRLLEELRAWEYAQDIDSTMVVASAGVLWHEFSQADGRSRARAVLPARQRQVELRAYYERVPDKDAANDIIQRYLRVPSGPPRWEDWLQINGRIEPASLEALVEIGVKLIRDHDQRHGFGEPAANLKSGVLGAMLEGLPGSGGWNVIRQFNAAMGGFMELKTDQVRSAAWADLVTDVTGRGQVFVSFIHNVGTLEQGYYRELFARRDRWPDGLALYALTTLRQASHFPAPNSGRVVGSWQRWLVPPRFTTRRHLLDQDGAHLLIAARVPRHTPGYILIGVRAAPELTIALATWRQRGLLALGAVLTLLLTIISRLLAGILRPMRQVTAGVAALESRQPGHHIVCGTGDEWDELARAFNEALRAMEEVAVAQVVQRRLLPAGPVATHGWRFTGRSIMTVAVGGDFYDAIPAGDGDLLFAIGDVAGHGVSAALVVAMAKAAFGALVAEGGREPTALLAGMNRLLHRATGRRKMMTCLLGRATPDGTVHFASAGHGFPVLRTAAGQTRLLEGAGSMPLGSRTHLRALGHSLHLAPGDRLLLYTDGIPEALNRVGQPFGYEGLVAAAASFTAPPPPIAATASEPPRPDPGPVTPASADALLAHVLARLHAWSDPVPWADDVTVAALVRDAATATTPPAP